MMKGEDYNDVLRKNPDAILRMVDQAVLRRRLNGSAEREDDPPNTPKEPKNELPEGFVSYSQIRPRSAR